MTDSTQSGDDVVGNNPRRNQAMEALVNKRNEDPDLIKETEEEEEDIIDLPLKKGEDGRWYATRKVNGEEEEVPFEDLVASSQKAEAAQRNFQEAARIRQEADRKVEEAEERLREYERRMAEFEAQQTTAPNDPPDEDDDEELAQMIKEYHQALYDDDQDKAVDLMKKIRGRSNATQVQANPYNPEDTRRLVQEMLKEERDRERTSHFNNRLEEAKKLFEKEYPQINSDSKLRNMADARTAELYQENPDRDPWDIIKEASDEVVEWLEQQGIGNKREQRKRDIEPQPQSANATGSIGDGEEKPQTRSDIIAELKKARNQKP